MLRAGEELIRCPNPQKVFDSKKATHTDSEAENAAAYREDNPSNDSSTIEIMLTAINPMVTASNSLLALSPSSPLLMISKIRLFMFDHPLFIRCVLFHSVKRITYAPVFPLEALRGMPRREKCEKLPCAFVHDFFLFAKNPHEGLAKPVFSLKSSADRRRKILHASARIRALQDCLLSIRWQGAEELRPV